MVIKDTQIPTAKPLVSFLFSKFARMTKKTMSGLDSRVGKAGLSHPGRSSEKAGCSWGGSGRAANVKTHLFYTLQLTLPGQSLSQQNR